MEKIIFDEIFIKEIDGRKLSLFSSDNLFYLKTDFRFSKIIFSVFASTADRESSSIKISGFIINARLIAIRCF